MQIHEGTEVRYFYPFDPLNYSNNVVDLNVVEEVRHLELRKKESLVWRVVKGAKVCFRILISVFELNILQEILAQAGLHIQIFCTRLFACF